MGRTNKIAIAFILLSLLIVIACAPLSIVRPQDATAVPAVPSNVSEVILLESTPTAPLAALPSATPTAVIQPATLQPISSDLYAFIQAPIGPVDVHLVT